MENKYYREKKVYEDEYMEIIKRYSYITKRYEYAIRMKEKPKRNEYEIKLKQKPSILVFDNDELKCDTVGDLIVIDTMWLLIKEDEQNA